MIHCVNSMMKAVMVNTDHEMAIEDNVPIPILRDNEVLIQIYSTAVNRADTLQRRGLYGPPVGESEILGLEAAGVIHDVGSSTKWNKGDRVMTLLSGGGYAEFVAVLDDHVLPIPNHIDFNQAAAIPEVWITAYQLTSFIGHVKPNSMVLVHAGASGVGTAAIQLINMQGASAIATVSTEEKAELARQCGAKHVIFYKTEKFDEKVLEMTGGRGVDMILDCIGSSYWEKNARSIAVDGTWVLYGLISGPQVDGPLLSTILRKRVRLEGTLLRSRSNQYKTNLVSDFRTSVLPHLVSGKLRTIVDSEMSLENVGEAHKRMENNLNAGKIILTVRSEESERKQEL